MAYNPLRNLGLKVMALLLATLLWFTVAGEHQVERALRVPLEFRNKPVHLEIVGEPPTTVDVRVFGSSAVLGRMDPGEVVAVLDLSAARPGSRLFHVRPEAVRVPFGVEVVQLTPATISLELEPSLKRTVRVIPAIEGDVAPGYSIGTISVDPEHVEVIGPATAVRQLDAATTEPVAVANASAAVTDTVTIGLPDPAIRLIEPRDARVTVQVTPAPVERELEGVPVRWRSLGPGYRARIEPQVVRVTVRGGRSAVDAIGPAGIDAFVDLAGLGPGQYNLRVQFDPTDNVGVSTVDPAVVQVTIK